MPMYHNNHGRTISDVDGHDDRGPRFLVGTIAVGDGSPGCSGSAWPQAWRHVGGKDGHGQAGPTAVANNPTGWTSTAITRVSSERGVIPVVETSRDRRCSACPHVVPVESDGQAPSAVSEFRPSCILLDVGLPGMDGIEVRRRLRADCDRTLASCSAPHVTTRSTVSWD